MKYLIKIVLTCPDGSVTRVSYHIAKDENEMKNLLLLDGDYTNIYCLGPVSELPELITNCLEKLEKGE